jgi:hypothetical protein
VHSTVSRICAKSGWRTSAAKSYQCAFKEVRLGGTSYKKFLPASSLFERDLVSAIVLPFS